MTEDAPPVLIGNIAVDIPVYAPTVGPHSEREDLPAEIRLHPGGSVYNHAQALRPLAGPARIASIFAPDHEGKFILDGLAADGLPTDFLLPLLDRNHKTVLVVSSAGDKIMWTDHAPLPPAGNVIAALLPLVAGSPRAHIAPNPWSMQLAVALSRRGAVLSTDVHVGFEPTAHPEFLSAVDILFFSAKGVTDVRARMSQYLAAGPRLVACTDGARGCLVAGAGKRPVVFPAAAPAGEVLDTVGAGDVFAATFLWYHHLGASLQEAVLRAQLQAGHACTMRGLRHLLPRAMLDRRYAAAVADQPATAATS